MFAYLLEVHITIPICKLYADMHVHMCHELIESDFRLARVMELAIMGAQKLH